jgi:beta-N-acetylhexosaminidase
MMAHVIYDRVDDQPAGYSRYWIETVLRGQLDFDGVVFSDDLNMAGAESVGGFAARAERALAAGCDILLVCNNAAGADEVLASLKGYSNPTSQLRLVRMHGGPGTPDLFSSPRWNQACAELERFHQKRGLSDGEDLFE